MTKTKEFHRELESERARWLRRRFLVFCWLWAIVSTGVALLSLLAFNDEGQSAALTAWDLATTLGSLAIATAAGIYAWRTPVRPAVLFGLSYVLTVAGFAMAAAFWRGQVLLDGDPGTTLRDAARGLPLGLLVRHLLPCMLIPWTLRESLRPAGVLVLIVAVVLLFDVARGSVPAGPAAGDFVLSCLAVAPGALVCWWRHSRFHRNFTLRFESSMYRRLQSELASARRVHESCLPAPIDDGPVRLSYAYEPMRQIGGDLLFVYPPPELRARSRNNTGDRYEDEGRGPPSDQPVSVVVLDVTGHGIAAALIVNRLVGELERIFADDPAAGPARVLAGLNRYVTFTLARYELYATALCVRIDPAAMTLEWASGGHPPACLRRAGGGTERLESTAPILGVIEPAEYDPEPQGLPIRPGDVLLAYTDGASEAADAAARHLGTAGVERLFASVSTDGMPSASYPDAILTRVAAHRAGDPEDDTLIVSISFAAPRRDVRSAKAAARPHELVNQ